MEQVMWADRFWSKVDASGDCWEWIGTIHKTGYGEFKLDGQNLKAHRLGYELLCGAIPDGLHIDHLCMNRRCVNPDHLEPVSPGENVRRSPVTLAGMNTRKTKCVSGHVFSGENTYISTVGKRVCRACGREAVRRYKERKAAAA